MSLKMKLEIRETQSKRDRSRKKVSFQVFSIEEKQKQKIQLK